MTIIEITGRITEDGKLEAELPTGLPAGEVQITVEIPEPSLTDEELRELMRIEPLSGAEIVALLNSGELSTDAWDDPRDGATWVEEERAKRLERSKW